MLQMQALELAMTCGRIVDLQRHQVADSHRIQGISRLWRTHRFMLGTTLGIIRWGRKEATDCMIVMMSLALSLWTRHIVFKVQSVYDSNVSGRVLLDLASRGQWNPSRSNSLPIQTAFLT
mmetsp:Transcript_2769/g.4281  ORF Transcript_2769/g.4281 Transcript_2769/m.4281 type:complete len:120 (+) Transcript_2769:363-722(+)